MKSGPNEKGRQQPTLLDVASHAKVSIASVSRVLNNVPPISTELRALVEASILAVGYKVKRQSSSLQPTVVAVIGDANNTYFAEILSGIQDHARKQGFLVNVVVKEPDADFSSRFYRWIIRANPEGLILCGSYGISEEYLLRIRDFGNIPVVAINRALTEASLPTVRIDYERAMATVVRHVVKFRHRRIAFLNGPEEAYSSRAKRIGVENTLAELGLPLAAELHVERPATMEGGFEAMNAIFDLPPERRPTAVIASSDLMAFGAMHAIRIRGLSIPNDMTVVGFDDIAMAAHSDPPLTTIAPPKFEMGARAMKLALESRASPKGQYEEYLVMESPLIVRESSGHSPE